MIHMRTLNFSDINYEINDSEDGNDITADSSRL